MAHERFLSSLRENPADLTSWLVYADWLDEHDDQTGPFIRLSLNLSAGRVPAAETEARVSEFEKLLAAAQPEARELLALYRSGLPTRFRILGVYLIGEDPPREMFGYARTVACGFLETGRIKPGMDLGVGTRADGRPRVVQGIERFTRSYDELVAGREPIHACLGWLGYLKIEAGRVLEQALPIAAPQPAFPAK